MSTQSTWQAVLEFWLGPLDDNGLAGPDASPRWWKKDPTFDAEITERFATTYDWIAAGGHAEWAVEPRGRLAAIIVLDQFARNMFRDTPGMYAQDELARCLVHEGIKAGADKALQTDERVFMYMPMMHSETLAEQRYAEELFAAMRDELEGPARERIASNVRFAAMHREVVEQFGRFPHRNGILGRPNTPEEDAYLSKPGAGF